MDPKHTPVSGARRRWFATAGGVGALAAVASVLPTPPAVSSQPAPSAPPKPHRGGGYHLSAHVEQYYRTTRV